MTLSLEEKVPDLSGAAYTITDIGRDVLKAYGEGQGPLAIEDPVTARQKFAAAALAELHAIQLGEEPLQGDL